MYQTIDEAKAAAEAKPHDLNHVYIYRIGALYDIYWHSEDRYVDGFIPRDAKIVWHAHVFGLYERIFTWDERASNYSQEDLDVLRDQLGDDKADALWKMLHDDTDGR